MITKDDLLIEPDMILNEQEIITLDEYVAYLNKVEYATGKEVHISKRSGIRSVEYEKRKGRAGTSQHSTYNLPGRGAVDLVYTKELLDYLKSDKFFTRICWYNKNGFIHCDRKPMPKTGVVYFFKSKSLVSGWVLQEIIS